MIILNKWNALIMYVYLHSIKKTNYRIKYFFYLILLIIPEVLNI